VIRSKYFYLAAILLVFATALYFSISGVDFGDQWDQNQIKDLVNVATLAAPTWAWQEGD